ncbi:carbon-nitrogen hydrolase family protein [Corynebacterium callunae]|uniref:carbon-nitrogen hydrolase family protein n=1 Tax=Corynebacterium callunae TaxID=1721 RepID=UPI003981AEEC
MRIALLQITTNADKMSNFEHLREAARDAASKGARVLVFPEATSQAFGTGRLDQQAEDLDGEFASATRELADELGVVIVAGMFAPADTVEKDGKTISRVHNTALITGAGLHQGYRKIHTYDAFGYRESDTVKPGEELVLFEVDGVTFGVAICYDIRFPEQFKDLARRGAQIIVVPTSWQDGPGKVEQWQVLSRARALDSTTWIAACGQARPTDGRKGPTGAGHSVVVDPTGKAVAEAGYEEETLIVDIDLSSLEDVRKSIPVL